MTTARSRTEPGAPSPGAGRAAGQAGAAPSRFRDDAQHRARDSLLIEPPRRLWPSLLGGAVMFLAGGLLGVLATVELLDGTPAPGPVATTTEAPPPGSAQLRRDTERMQAAAELAALRQATAAERARLETLAERRSAAEAELAALQERALAEPAAAMPRQVPVVEPPPMATAQPAAPPAAAPRQTPRSRGEARAEPRPDGRVQLHYLAGSPVAQQAAEDAAAALRDAGVEGVELRASPAVPDNRLVRYHRAEDAGAAARLAGRLGRGWALQDSRGYDPGGAARGLEIWLPDR